MIRQNSVRQCLSIDFKQHKINVALSVYSYEKKWHDKVTGELGSWQKTNSAIKMLADAIDLGAMNTRVFVKGKGVVLEVPTVVALQAGTKRVLAVGDEAKEMQARTPGNIVAVRPLVGGVIADYDLTEAFLRFVFGKLFARPWWARCFKPRAVIAVPSGITEVEKCAVETAAHAAGAGDVFLIERPMAAAIGVGLDRLSCEEQEEMKVVYGWTPHPE